MPRQPIAILLALLLCQCSFTRADPTTTAHRIQVAKLTRTFSLHIPATVSDAKAAPLVIVLHGSGDTGTGIEAMTKFSQLADREGFIVAYPDALAENWNDGREAPAIESQTRHVDDVGFVEAMIDDIARQHRLDPKRIYATGFSNGGILADYLGAHLAHRLAAIAPVSGGIAEPFAQHFPTTEKLATIFRRSGTRRLQF